MIKYNIPFIFILAIAFLLINLQTVSADLVNPDFIKSKCKYDEIETVCFYRSPNVELAFLGIYSSDECLQYKYNPSYYYLAGEGHSLGGREKYCKLPDGETNPEIIMNYFIASGIGVFVIALVAMISIIVVKKKHAKR